MRWKKEQSLASAESTAICCNAFQTTKICEAAMTKSALQKAKERAILKRLFDAGEQWGVTYSTWFSPSAEDTEEQASPAIRHACASLAAAQRKGRK